MATLTVDAAQLVDLGRLLITTGHQVLTLALGQAPDAAGPTPDPLPPIRAHADTSDRLARIRAQDRERKAAKRKAAKAQLSLDVDGATSIGQDTPRPAEVSGGFPPDASMDSRAVFSSLKAVVDGEDKKNNCLELDKEGKRPPDASMDSPPPVQRTNRSPILPAEDIAPFLEAFEEARGVPMAVNAKDQAALKRVLYSPPYANGDRQEALRRWRIGLRNNYPTTHTFQDLERCWNGLTQPQSPPTAKAQASALAAVDRPSADDTPCTVPDCDRSTEGKRYEQVPLCYPHIAQAVNAEVRGRGAVAAWARAQGGAV